MLRSVLAAAAAVLVAWSLIPPNIWPAALTSDHVNSSIAKKNILITGASYGIGKDLAKEYASVGAAQIVIVARSPDKLARVRSELIAEFAQHSPSLAPPTVHIIPADLSTESTCQDVIDRSVELLGGDIDHLVLNHITNSRYGLWARKSRSSGRDSGSGSGTSSPATNSSSAKVVGGGGYGFVQELMAVNTLSYIWLATAALESLERSAGTIVVVSSFAGLVGVPHTILYSASKHALGGFFSGLRTELSLIQRSPVTVTIAHLGSVDTEGVGDVKAKIDVVWEPPREVAKSIVVGAAYRLREVYHPYAQIYPAAVLARLCPQLIEHILSTTMHS